MNITNMNKRGPAYGFFAEISCRNCGDIPNIVQKNSEDGKSFENTFPDNWYVEVDINEKRILNVVCPNCSRKLKIKKLKNYGRNI